MNDWWLRRVVQFNSFNSALGWNENFTSAVCWNENSISAVRWNGIYSLKWICATKICIYGRASRPIHHTKTIQIHVNRAGRASRAGPLVHAHASPRTPSSWNGNQQLKWNFRFSIQLKWNFHFSPPKLKWNSIKILVAQRDHIPFHLRASIELPVKGILPSLWIHTKGFHSKYVPTQNRSMTNNGRNRVISPFPHAPKSILTNPSFFTTCFRFMNTKNRVIPPIPWCPQNYPDQSLIFQINITQLMESKNMGCD